MAVSEYPAAYSAAKEPVMFTIDDEGVIEVEINGYYKQLQSTTRSVNVAPYFRGEFDIKPLELMCAYFFESSEVKRLVFNADTASSGMLRSVDAYITIDSTASSSVKLAYSDSVLTPDVFLSDVKHRIIGVNEIDEFMVLRDEIDSIEIIGDETEVVSITGYTNLCFCYINPSKYAASGNVTVNLTKSEEIVDTITYTVIAATGIRLAWINAYGGIDMWTFFKDTVDVSIEKESIYLGSGYKSVDVRREVSTTLYSRPVVESTLIALSYILNSDSAWILTDDYASLTVGDETARFPGWKNIDITSTSANIFDSTMVSSLSVTYRPITR